MAHYYVEHSGNWNVFSSIVDDFLYDQFMPFSELKAIEIAEEAVKVSRQLDTLLIDRPRVNTMAYEEAIELRRKDDKPEDT